MPLDTEIVIVSGLPRSGTSLMMQMLDRAGIPAVTDEIRTADTDNPRGYFEFERVKRTKEDPSWLRNARGKAVKMVSSLLYDLPATESYRILFMQRDIDEVLQSQEKMLRRLGRTGAPPDQLKASFGIHLERLYAWLPQQGHMLVLNVSYNRLMHDPQAEVHKVSQFLEGRAPVEPMLQAIDPELYRNRSSADGIDRS